MSFGPTPYRMAAVRESSKRGVQKKSTPCADVSPELIGIEQLPSVNTPSVFDDAVQSAKTLEEKLLVNVDGLLAKAESIQKSIQGAVSEVTGQIGSAIEGGVQSAFESIDGFFNGTDSKDCVAFGVPDTNKIDVNAFGGGVGAATAIPSVSLAEDEEQDQIAQQLAVGGGPSLPELGSGFDGGGQVSRKPLPTGVETAVLEPQKFEVPPVPDQFDGGQF